MEIETLKKTKADMEMVIRDMLSEYSKRTGLDIARVNVEIIDTSTICAGKETRIGTVEIELII